MSAFVFIQQFYNNLTITTLTTQLLFKMYIRYRNFALVGMGGHLYCGLIYRFIFVIIILFLVGHVLDMGLSHTFNLYSTLGCLSLGSS